MLKFLNLFPVLLLISSTFTIRAQNDSLRRFSFVASLGPTFFTGNNQDEIDRYVQAGFDKETAADYYFEKGMGYQLNAMANYRFTKLFSAALQYRLFSASAECSGNFDLNDGIHLAYGRLSESITVNYAGAGLYLEDLFRIKKMRYRAGFSAGIAFYRNALWEIWFPYLVTGKTMMFGPSVGAEIPAGKRISILVDASYMHGSIKTINVRTEDDSRIMNLEKEFLTEISNIGLTAAIKFAL